MKFDRFRNVFARMYTDTFSVYRHGTSKNEDGSTKMLPAWETEPIYEDLPCKISYRHSLSYIDPPYSFEYDHHPVRTRVNIFTQPTHDIRKGDWIVAKRTDEEGNTLTTYEGLTNLPFRYTTHQEILIQQDGDA